MGMLDIIAAANELTSSVRRLTVAKPSPDDEMPSQQGPVVKVNERINGDTKVTPYGLYVGNYQLYEEMSRCPTLAFVRSTVVSPLRQLSYTVESEDGVPEDFGPRLDRMLRDVFPTFVDKCSLSLDYGWLGGEKVWEKSATEWRVVDLLDLPPSRCGVVVDKFGRFSGLEYRQHDKSRSTLLSMSDDEGEKAKRIPRVNSFIMTHQMRFGNYYGLSRYENCLSPNPAFPGAYDLWLRAMQNAAGAVRKAGGSVVIVYYPKGKVRDRNGSYLTNYQQAVTIAQAVSEGRPVVVENLSGVELPELISNPNLAKSGMWAIETKDLGQSANAISGVIEAALHADKFLCRSFYRPERAVLEAAIGGSRADSETHGDVAMLDSEAFMAEMMEAINRHLVEDLVRLNFGNEYVGKLRLQPVPIVSHKTARAWETYRLLMQNVDMARQDALPRTDVNAVMDAAGVPKTTDGPVEPIEVAQPKETPVVE